MPARPGHGDQMDDRVGRTADGHVDRDRVVERGGSQDARRLQILEYHLDDAPPAGLSHARMGRMHGGDRRGAGQREPSVSAAAVIVEAVPMVMQCPGDRAIPSSIPRQAQSSRLPAQRSASISTHRCRCPALFPSIFL